MFDTKAVCDLYYFDFTFIPDVFLCMQLLFLHWNAYLPPLQALYDRILEINVPPVFWNAHGYIHIIAYMFGYRWIYMLRPPVKTLQEIIDFLLVSKK